jgi:hypothetical protein
MSEVCEHGHLRRKCEVCELKAEVTRLRGVCDLACDTLCMVLNVAKMNVDARGSVLKVAETLANEGSKSDGQ